MRIPLKANLIPTSETSDRPPRRPFISRVLRAARAVGITVVVAFVVLAWTTRSSDANVFVSIRESVAVRSVLSLIRNPNSTLIGQREDRVNILLLGMGGEGHEGPYLTDTIILASIQPSTRRASLISIPRDLAIPLADGSIQKVNAINAFAEAAAPGSGGDTLRAALHDALGIEIPYYLRVDFTGFAGLIDELGGVDVTVERTIDDPQYPIAGNENAPWAERFERLVIPKGPQRLDGATALKYVRSRHARGNEGSDFARARRQQRLLLAVGDRALARDVLTNPRRALALLDAWRQHVDTNLSPPELHALAKLAPDITGDAVSHVVFTDAPDGELVARLLNGAYVLQPREGSFDRIQRIVRSAFDQPIVVAPAPPPPQFSAEVWNGTTIAGLAARTADILAREGLTVTAIRNAPVRNIERSIIYYRLESNAGDRGSGTMQTVVDRLRVLLAADTSTAFPAFEMTPSNADILVIVGTSSVVRAHDASLAL